MRLVTISDIRAAADLLAPAVLRTPLLPCAWADADRPLWLKPENLQPVGAFKIRGAFHAIAKLPEDVRALGVVAYSSGNHAQAVAYAAKLFGVPAVIVVPDNTPQVKIDATLGHGAEVHTVPMTERESRARYLSHQRGSTLIPPFDHVDVIAGQGTVGLEIAEDLPDVHTVLVPVSGGGLISGVAVAIKALCPDARVIGVEPALAADAAESLRAGRRSSSWSPALRARTIADGLRAEPSELTFAHMRELVDGIVTVSESDIRAAVPWLAHNSRLIAEPSGAVTVAAYLNHQDELPPGKTVAIISGGNLDPALLNELLTDQP
ncbi:threonine/serine dehydratase [Umezawaea sp. Da 62-37]|uniref:threonine ammonia-lyase n=1 Tax=Umezawaea sp. Da 62-37 TaxID=3075927 RepID=UPI0028F72A87|nr:threonine/serine dehydratase [Umezawaea sp. Da 62-37]WNV81956.1 threonine/serine dehydratase [Umezawaea sp. Da 62-37]